MGLFTVRVKMLNYRIKTEKYRLQFIQSKKKLPSDIGRKAVFPSQASDLSQAALLAS
ncbi:MAG: hypothetical protein RI973_861 [Bacteroidota bacterium]|jgi:hypothetical protein